MTTESECRMTSEDSLMPQPVTAPAAGSETRALSDVSWPFPRHELKTVPPYFDAVWSETKTFEVRRDDRGFQPGDLLVLREWLPEVRRYSPAKPILREVTYVLRDAVEFGVAEGFVVLGIKPVVSS